MHILLESLELTHFKGIEHLRLTFGGHAATIYGQNGVGKTTVADAYYWVLFGKDSTNKKEFEIKTVAADGTPAHNLSHAVEALFTVDNTQVTLRKVYAEKWTKKRGQATPQFAGHSTEYFIDGVPVAEKEYTAQIASWGPETVFRAITSPTYFNEQLSWQDRRRLLLQVVGDVADSQVISSDSALQDLPALLAGRSLEAYRRILDAQRKDLQKSLNSIPVRIDEVRRSLPTLPDAAPPTRDEVAGLEAELAAQQKTQQEVLAGGVGGIHTQQRLRLQHVEAELFRIENEARRVHARQVDQLITHARKLERVALDTKTQHQQATDRIAWLTREHESLEQRIASLRQDWHRVNTEVFSVNSDTVCPTCGQDLPQEQIETAVANALAAFNRTKSARLETIQAEGKTLRNQAQEIRQELETLLTQQDALQTLGEAQQEAAQDALARIEQAEQRGAMVQPNDPTYVALLTERDELRAALDTEPDTSAAEQAIADTIAQLRAQLKEAHAAWASAEQRASGEQRIAELRSEEKALATQYEELERQAHMMEQFTRAKVALLEGRINQRFHKARFTLFDSLINGGLQEVCRTTFQGVPYPDLNHAAQIQIGLDIVQTLSQQYQLVAPIFVDGRESVSELPDMDAQVISLVVSPEDTALRMVSHSDTKAVV